MATMRLGRRVFLIAAAGVLLAPACLSPTLPLPPPGEPTVEQVGQNQYLLTGSVPTPGFVNVLNLRTNVIVGQATEDRSYSVLVEARPDDLMRMWYSDDNKLSDPLEFVIEKLLPPGAGSDGGTSPGPDGSSDAGP